MCNERLPKFLCISISYNIPKDSVSPGTCSWGGTFPLATSDSPWCYREWFNSFQMPWAHSAFFLGGWGVKTRNFWNRGEGREAYKTCFYLEDSRWKAIACSNTFLPPLTSARPWEGILMLTDRQINTKKIQDLCCLPLAEVLRDVRRESHTDVMAGGVVSLLLG